MHPAQNSGSRSRNQEAGLEPATRQFDLQPWEEVRHPALPESDVTPQWRRRSSAPRDSWDVVPEVKGARRCACWEM